MNIVSDRERFESFTRASDNLREIMTRWHYDAPDERATEALAGRLAGQLFEGALLLLDGPLGAGKTRFVRALAAAAGVAEQDVTSPTFVLWQQYLGRTTLHHLDVYRLRDDDEFLALGIEEHLASGQGWTLIEWASRAGEVLPEESLAIEIAVTGPESRRFEFTAHGTRYSELLSQLALAAENAQR